jgi:CHASE2 domain-containing sensor protein
VGTTAKYGAAAALSVLAGYLVYKYVAKVNYTPVTAIIDAGIGVASYYALTHGGWVNVAKGVIA